MPEVAIAIGSNVDPGRNLPAAIGALQSETAWRVLAASRVYAASAAGPSGQPEFHNAAVLIETDLGPLGIRRRLRAIEARLGRERTDDKYEPRTADLDIIFYGSVILHNDEVSIPDPDASRFPHIYVPLADVAPDWHPPEFETPMRDLAATHDLTPLGRDPRSHVTG